MTAPSAAGTLADTPLAHALIYARNRRLSGRLELMATNCRAVVTLWCGRITSVETTPIGVCPGGFFGAIVYELGYIDAATLDATLLEVAKTKRLHGEVLIERKAITPAQRDEALVEQVHRKIHFLFSLPDTTTYAFYDAKVSPGEPPVAVDPVGPVWRGIRDFPPMKFVHETIRRVGGNALRVTAGGSARLPPAEASLAEMLALTPMTLRAMKERSELPPSRVELLVYLLVIAKCVEAVSGERTHPSTGALPVTMPSGPVRVSGETRLVSGSIPAVRPQASSIPTAQNFAPPPAAAFRPTQGATPAPQSFKSIPSSAKIPVPPIAQRPSMTSIPAMRAVQSKAPGAASSATELAVAMRPPGELGLDGIRARASRIESEDYFRALGLEDGASAEAVRAAFFRLAKVWHPDRLPSELQALRAEVGAIFSHMTRAHQTLCDEEARRAYVASRGARSAKPAPRPRTEIVREIEHAMRKRDFEFVSLRCQELIDANRDDAEAHATQAWAETRGGEATEEELRAALAKVEKAIHLDRTCDQALYYRGLLHKRLDNVPAAFRDFARVVQLNPKHTEAEREVRIFAMRARKGSGEHKLGAILAEKFTGKK
ncbi:MAG TPA: J domain-containing protein [Labilithrix sp.]|nr:J domain-containing protein [Labilithrix sp.]